METALAVETATEATLAMAVRCWERHSSPVVRGELGGFDIGIGFLVLLWCTTALGLTTSEFGYRAWLPWAVRALYWY